MSRRRPPRAGRDAGQATTEYLMIAGLLTAMILALTQIIVPAIAWAVARLATHMAVYVSSVN
jgi:Flp pilus assembly pilin Flp